MGRHLDSAHSGRDLDTAPVVGNVQTAQGTQNLVSAPGFRYSDTTLGSGTHGNLANFHAFGNRFINRASRISAGSKFKFECPRCGKNFSRKWTLHRHMLTTDGKCFKVFSASEYRKF
jgi:uncharacterized C2H2 Zn-finger protein